MVSKLTENMVSGTLLYTCIQQPTTKYQSKEKEWKVSVVVSEDVADDWGDRFQKQPAKVIKTSEFKDKYKIDPVYPDEKKQYIINLKKNVLLANGEPVPEYYQPKVFIDTGNGKVMDITQETLVGNGSTGCVSFETHENDYGVFARLKNVKVDNLIKYESTDSGSNEFGEIDNSNKPEPSQDNEGGEFSQESPQSSDEGQDDFDDEAPF